MEVVSEVPWGPHDGLIMTLAIDPQEVMVNKIMRPKPLHELSQQNESGEASKIAWRSAYAAAKTEIGKQQGDYDSVESKDRRQTYAETLGISGISEALARDWAIWCRALEIEAISGSGKNVEETKCFKGRAESITLRKCPLLRNTRLTQEALPIPGGMGITARLWATCKMMARKLKRCLQMGADKPQIWERKILLLRLVACRTGDLRKAWETSIDRADRAAAARALFLAISSETTQEKIDIADKMFARLEEAEARRAKEISKENGKTGYEEH